jgi:signal transduction histidine kinase
MTTSIPATVPPVTEQSDARPGAARLRAGSWRAALALYAALVGIWLLIGLVVAAAAHSSALHTWAQAAADGKHGSAWTSFGRGLIAGAAHSYPVSGVVLDYVYSAALLLVAAGAVRLVGRDRTSRFLVIGLVGTAAAFNLQAHTGIDALAAATGWSSGLFDWLHTVLLHGVGVAAYLVALVVFPTGKLEWINVRSNAARTLVTLLAGVLALALGASSNAYPHTLSFLIFFGLIAPLCGGAVQSRRLIRPATAEARQQSRILLWALGATLAVAVLLVGIALGTQALTDTPGLPKEVPGIAAGMPGMTGHLPGLEGLGSQTVVFWIFRVLSIAVPCAVLVGLLRLRLWTFELLANRALTYGVLAAVIGAVYVFGVVRVDAWLGLDSDWLAPPQVAAAGLVALAFHPVRVRLERLADRLLYGRRIAPYDVLAQISALSNSGGGGPGESALTDLARIVAQGLRARYAIAYLDLEDGTEARYQWPSEVVRTEDAERTIAVEYRGSPVGKLVIPAQAGRVPANERRALLDHLARAAGVVMHNARLTVDLEHRLRVIEARAAEIRASRWRIVAAQDSERRELERDLHDGAQPGLTAVRLSLGLVSHLVASGSDKASEALLRLRSQIDDATLSLRQTLRGLAPTALGEHGIIRALEELAESLGADVDFHVDDETRQARFNPQTEAAVYFCCAEAIQNAVKHCPGAAVAATLRWESDRSRLLFEIADDGPGFDAAASTGNGIQNMADRIGAAGGVLKIESEPGTGTKVSGSVPTTPGEDESPALAVSRKSNATP